MSFKSSLRMGNLGEAVFYMAHGDELKKEDGRRSDFSYKSSGEHVEVKTDLFDMEKTPNFFMEKWSDRDAKKLGGPWRAFDEGVKHFVYFFLPNLTYFTFDTAQLVGALEEMLPRLKPIEVPNKSWVTEGYRVPRESLKALYVEVKLKVSRE